MYIYIYIYIHTHTIVVYLLFIYISREQSFVVVVQGVLVSPMCVCLVAQLCPTLCDPIDCNLPGSSVHGDSPGKNTGVGCHFLLQGIFPTQGLNPGVLHYRWILSCLIHQGSPGGLKSQPFLSP